MVEQRIALYSQSEIHFNLMARAWPRVAPFARAAKGRVRCAGKTRRSTAFPPRSATRHTARPDPQAIVRNRKEALSEELARLEVTLAQVAARKAGDAAAGAEAGLPGPGPELDALAARMQERVTECAGRRARRLSRACVSPNRWRRVWTLTAAGALLPTRSCATGWAS